MVNNGGVLGGDWAQVVSTFRKTAINFHYEFTVRHLANVFQGMLMSSAEQFNDPVKMSRLWLHESERVYADRLVPTPCPTHKPTLTLNPNEAARVLSTGYPLPGIAGMKVLFFGCWLFLTAFPGVKPTSRPKGLISDIL